MMADPKSFNENYRLLQANADKLRKQEELDIDALVPIVEESAKAYQVCKERIAAVRQALDKHLQEQPAGGKGNDA